jgi:N6-adenosine-specific RNA methylase IME4
MGRRPIKKSGAMTPSERQRKRRRKLARERKLANPKLVAKQERRAERERSTAGKILTLPDKKYGVFYADPEWRDEVYSRETGLDRAADNHYSTSEVEAIKARRALIDQLAAKPCVLFLWSTIQHEKIAHDVMEAWGFEYKSQVIWLKPSISLGRWIRSGHEILLIGTRGNPPCPAPGKQWPSVIEAPRPGSHSTKPEIFYRLIEAYYPTMPKIELNARIRRPGWDPWGLEAPPDNTDGDYREPVIAAPACRLCPPAGPSRARLNRQLTWQFPPPRASPGPPATDRGAGRGGTCRPRWRA